jgi:hypothetical protein
MSVGSSSLRARMPIAFARGALLAAMCAGSVMLWLGVPAGWIWLASRLTSTNHFVFLAALGCCPPTMIALLGGLARLQDAYGRLGGDDTRKRRVPPAWRRSLRAERRPHQPPTALDVILVVSAVCAVMALHAWFFFLSNSPLESVQVLGH